MMTINWQSLQVGMVSIAFVLSACSSKPEVREPLSGNMPSDKPALATAKDDATGCGNDPSYTIDGTTYQVLESSAGYSETGTAAWYGAEYQGTETAGCERFDMNMHSAAHRTLPLPSFVRVTNRQNGQSIIVRVNDRGPFDSKDLIQLSFAAANALGISKRTGTPVQLDALAPDRAAGSGQPLPPANPAPAATPNKKVAPIDKSKVFYVVVGTWPDRNKAIDLFVRLTSVGLAKTEMATVREQDKEMHQVRIGPLYNQDQIDNVKDALESNGLASFRVVEARQ